NAVADGDRVGDDAGPVAAGDTDSAEPRSEAGKPVVNALPGVAEVRDLPVDTPPGVAEVRNLPVNTLPGVAKVRNLPVDTPPGTAADQLSVYHPPRAITRAEPRPDPRAHTPDPP